MSQGAATAEIFAGARVLVAGLGKSGRSAATALAELGAHVIAADSDEAVLDQWELPKGVEFVSRSDADELAEAALAQSPELIVSSPGIRPTTPILARAKAPIISEVELAWRICPRDIPWLTITGTNGKTTTVGMLSSILSAHGWDAPAVGNVGTPIVTTALAARSAQRRPNAFAVELSSFQLHFTSSLAPLASTCLNIDADHLDWHGGMDAYVRAKAKVYENTQSACVYNVADPRTRTMVAEADVAEGARAVGFSLSTPAAGDVGLVEDVLVDRAFVANRSAHAVELATTADLAHLGGESVAPHNIANALAASALARAADASPQDISSGLRSYVPGGHRMQQVAVIDGVAYVDDSKATNAHAAAAALAAMSPHSVVWIAGGLAKGARFEELVRRYGDRLRAAVIIGVDPEPMVSALSRHAPHIPREVVPSSDTDVMKTALARARGLARPGDTVLLAPACASMDQFASYAARGDAFSNAAKAIAR